MQWMEIKEPVYKRDRENEICTWRAEDSSPLPVHSSLSPVRGILF